MYVPPPPFPSCPSSGDLLLGNALMSGGASLPAVGRGGTTNMLAPWQLGLACVTHLPDTVSIMLAEFGGFFPT